MTGGVNQSLQVGCQVELTGQIDNNLKNQDNPVSDNGNYKREKKTKRKVKKGELWFDTDDCELIKALVVDTEEKQDLKPPDNNEVDWIIGDKIMRDCKISEYGPVGFGQIKFPTLDDISTFDNLLTFEPTQIWTILNGKEVTC